MIEWVINSSKKVNLIDKILLTTDSAEIRKIALQNNISSPFLRPKKLSTDSAKSSDVIIHVLNYLKKEKEIYDFFILLEPTSPFTSAKDIEKSIKFQTC